jgi:phage shock protein A
MTVIKKLVTLLRGSAREIGESVVDSNATRIYEQEIIDAKHSIEKAKGDIERLKNEAARYEGLALEALNKTQEGLALDVASKVGLLEQELEEQAKAHASYALQVSRLKELIKSAEARIREHEREINIAKTTESVYRATQSISENIGSGGSRLANARESLERIRARHEDLADRMTASQQLESEFGHGALEKKLAAAGIGNDADRTGKVMERIRARQTGAAGGTAAGTGTGAQ